eukprot:TRINITY_DN1122_c0_g1_i1.p1 TRINITY_DN1122_c0_g1~~TRINITY_DN1122_c0_g1_i1.p1  ORF type:complete len:504 (-),score=93.23 TRINITY_DN1122_c0_g1_i1:149-1660(-)
MEPLLSAPVLPPLSQEVEPQQDGIKSTDSTCGRPCCSSSSDSAAQLQAAVPMPAVPPTTQPEINYAIPVIGERAPATAAEAQAQAHAAFVAVSRGFSCQWEGCMMNFLSQQDLLSHIVTHAASPPKRTPSPFVVVSQPPAVLQVTSPSSSSTISALTSPPTATVVTDKPEEIVPLLLQNQPVPTPNGSVAVQAPTVVVTTCANPSHHLPQPQLPAGAICTEAHPHVHHEHEHHHMGHQHSHTHNQQHGDDDRHSSDSSDGSNMPPPSTNNRKKNPKKRKGSTIDENDDDLDEDRKYSCDITGCEKAFKRSGHLKRHKLIHQPKDARERFHCSQAGCIKNYSTKYDLAAHIRQVHMGMLLYKCSVRGCCRRFVKQDSLVKHLTTFDHSKTHAASHREEGEFTGDLDLNDVLQAAQVQLQIAELQQQHQQQQILHHQQQQQQQQQPAGLGLVPVNIFNPFSSSGATTEFLSSLTNNSVNASGSDALDPSSASDMRAYANLFHTPQ